MKERRKFVRVRCEIPVKYKVIGDASSMFQGALAKDVCLNGIRFRTDRFIGVQSKLLMELQLPSASRPALFIAKPAWVRELPGAAQYELGNIFEEIDDDNRALIEAFVGRGMAGIGQDS